MPKKLLLIGLLALPACSGGGPETAGSNAAPTGATTASEHTFVNPTVVKTYQGVGGSQVYEYTTDNRNCCGQQGQLYAGHSSTVRDSSISIAYDPGNALFTLSVQDPKSGATTNTSFQDPASRTDFANSKQPQWGTPQVADSNVRFLQAGDGNPRSLYSESGSGAIDPGTNKTPPNGDPAGSSYQSTTFFYEVPGTKNASGTTTKYVTYAGYLRNAISFGTVVNGGQSVVQDTWHLERGAFAYGEQTPNSAVPKTGTASFTGGMLATMVNNPTLDGQYGGELPTYYQWIEGTSKIDVDFAKSSVALVVTGKVFEPQIDRYTQTPATNVTSIVPAGATFTAAGTAAIDLVGTGGFAGAINTASFSATNNGAPKDVTIAGSGINGNFFGPAAQEVGGGFRVVGGTPDQRIDILGAFTGAKPAGQ